MQLQLKTLGWPSEVVPLLAVPLLAVTLLAVVSLQVLWVALLLVVGRCFGGFGLGGCLWNSGCSIAWGCMACAPIAGRCTRGLLILGLLVVLVRQVEESCVRCRNYGRGS